MEEPYTTQVRLNLQKPRLMIFTSDLPAPGTLRHKVFMERLQEQKEHLATDDEKEKADKAYQYVAKSYDGYAFEASVFEAFKVLLESEHGHLGKKNVTLLQVIIQISRYQTQTRTDRIIWD